ncbi:MAG TPA: alkaline phosphatase family protein [bacterium]|nr:alkaline phosphatase family protein [bacterium]
MTAGLRRVGPAVLLLLAVLAAGASPAPQSSAAATVRHVVIMSFDGLGGEAAREAFPAAMVAQAAHTWTAQTTLPSSTLPAHTSMLTGVPPSVHGVRSNPTRPIGRVRLPTVFSIVTQQGGTAAAFVTKPKLLYLLPPGTVGRAELLPYPQYPMVAAAREAARYLAQAQPQLLFIHLSDPDDAGHRYGWGSAPYRQTAARVPEAVQVILDVLARMGRLEDSLVIVTADHGGRGRLHGGSTPAETTIPWLAFGAVAPGPITAPVMTYDTAATAIAALGWPVPSAWVGKPVVQPVEKVR